MAVSFEEQVLNALAKLQKDVDVLQKSQIKLEKTAAHTSMKAMSIEGKVEDNQVALRRLEVLQEDMVDDIKAVVENTGPRFVELAEHREQLDDHATRLSRLESAA